MDTPWWDEYHREVDAVGFKGMRLRGNGSARSNLAVRAAFGAGCLNSGAGALLMAAHYGATAIYMLGYDCGVGPGGARHWHADHPKGLGNAGSLNKWPTQFQEVRQQLRGCKVLNASRVTTLQMFERVTLDSIVNNE